jgi:hypothetical protein
MQNIFLNYAVFASVGIISGMAIFELASAPHPQKKTINGEVGHKILIFGGVSIEKRSAATM